MTQNHSTASLANRPWPTRILLALLLVAPPWVAQAQFTYTTNDGAITITKYTGSGGDVVIPEQIGGVPVRQIGDNAFWFTTGVLTVVIPNTVTSSGRSAISYCRDLTAITIPGKVTTIGDYAFDSCTSLTNATISNGVGSIGNGMFYYCISLSSVSIPQTVVSIGSEAFAGAPLIGLTIPDSVTAIGRGAFKGCSQLLSIAIPKGVTSIPDDVFGDCGRLGSVTLGNGVTNIGSYAFYYCSSLTTITIPKPVSVIGASGFEHCTKLTSVYFAGNAPSADPTAFTASGNATAYYVPGATGWGPTLANRPTALWNPTIPISSGNFGVRTNQFAFNITGNANMSVVVEASSDLINQVWTAVGTNTLVGGTAYFGEAGWTNWPARFYRLRSP